jgi:hypothetical protein
LPLAALGLVAMGVVLILGRDHAKQGATVVAAE